MTDADGVRVGSLQTDRSRADESLVVLGDSFSFGEHADYEQSIAGVLQERLANITIHTFAVPGASSSSYAKILAHYAERKDIRPQTVVVGLYVDMQVGDLPRLFARNRFGGYKAFGGYYFSPSAYREISQSRVKQGMFLAELFIRRNSSFLNIIHPREPRDEFAISLRDTLGEDDFPGLEAMVLSNLNAVREVAGLEEENIIVWFAPSNHELAHKLSGADQKTQAGQSTRAPSSKGFSLSRPRRSLRS